jgi:DNA-damage-inducible protein J
MSSVSVTVRMDADLKRQAERLFADIGLTTTAAVTVFAKACVREGRIPFELVGDPFWSPENQARLARGKEQLDTGGGSVHDILPD